MKRPRLTKRIVESLSQISDLAQNDMEADEERFTADDWAGIDYLNKLVTPQTARVSRANSQQGHRASWA
jgi:hypothetical protein